MLWSIVFKADDKISSWGFSIKLPEYDAETYYDAEISPSDFEVLVSCDRSANEVYWDKENEMVVVRKKPYLKITTNATDTDGDGIVDIPADGTSSATIYIKKHNSDDSLDTGFNEEVNLSTERGTLSAVKIALVNGEGQVTLTSAAETVLTTVRAGYEELAIGALQIFFRPT